MEWHYVEQGQQSGPVTEPELARLYRDGIITPDTLVWHEGLADWIPFREAKVDTTLPAPVPLPQIPAPPLKDGEVVCAECGKVFPAAETIQYQMVHVCAACKPVFLQKLSEGARVNLRAAAIWREGSKLVTHSGTPFPDVCVKCGAPANGFRLRRVLYWHHPAYYLLLFCNLLILLIVVLAVRKKAVLEIGLCEAHRRQRTLAIAMGWIGIVGGTAITTVGAVMPSGWTVAAGIILFLTGATWGFVKGRTLVATKIDGTTVWASGAGREFLNQLPER